MSVIDLARMENLGNGVMVGQNALLDMDLLGQARNFKKMVASRYRLMTEADLKYLEGNELSASLKVDGQLHFLAKIGDEVLLFNIKGRVLQGLPVLEQAKTLLADVDQVLIAGELYCQNTENRPRVYDVTSALGTGGSGNTDALAFAGFDLLEIGNENCRPWDFEKKQKRLNALMPNRGQCHAVEQHAVDAQGVGQLFKKWVTEGNEEGVVVVDDSNHTIYKVKPKHNVDAVILGFTESPDVTDSIRVLLTGLMRPDGSFQVFAKVGTGFDEEQKRDLFTRLSAMAVDSAFNTTDRNHTLFTMVRPEIVIEMAFHDLIYENTAGKPEMKPVLSYDPSTGYQTLLPEAFVSVLGPVFKKFREDKQVTPEDLRLTQLQDFVDLDNLSQASRTLDLANSEIKQREVYSKTTKELVSVRKFITWKTNKETIDPNYPAFVFCYVDYSPGRKDPLKRVIRTAPTEEAVQAIYEQYKESEIKRGWKPAE